MLDPCRHQNPDDTICRPCAFSTYDPQTGATVKTFFVYNPWHLVSTKRLGELVVRETADDSLLSITLE